MRAKETLCYLAGTLLVCCPHSKHTAFVRPVNRAPCVLRVGGRARGQWAGSRGHMDARAHGHMGARVRAGTHGLVQVDMKPFLSSVLLICLIGAAAGSVHPLPVCSKECESTIAQLQRRVWALERLLSKCNLPLGAETASPDTQERIQGNFGSEGKTRQLLQQNADHTSPQNGFTEVLAEHGAGPLRRTTGGEEVVRLGLLLPMTGWSAGKYIVGAATLAIADINANPSLMQGRRLEYTWANSGCSSIAGMRAIEELRDANKPIHSVIGGACSSACESTAFVSAVHGLLQVCCLFGKRCVRWSCTTVMHHRSHMAALPMCCHRYNVIQHLPA